MKDKISNDLSYIKAGYKTEKWKWVLNLPEATSEVQVHKPVIPAKLKEEAKVQNAEDSEKSTNGYCDGPSSSGDQSNGTPQGHQTINESQITTDQIMKTFGLDKCPKNLPCVKRCANNVWCLMDIRSSAGQEKARPTDQPRDAHTPVGLQNTANTCWINSALQALYHLPVFRNVINDVDGFSGDESLSSMLYLLQAMFVEMDTHGNKAIACSSGSVFERMGMHATREIMRKDADHQALKCVSEFLENTIDTLIADACLGPQMRPLFSTSLMRVARWRCPECKREQEIQLAPATSYTLAAYVSADECPLDQCLVDLQTETQTGVSLICGGGNDGDNYRYWQGGGGGCGASVKADRIVTPKIQSLPKILVIRNNSLVDRDLKRRLHVVYPETLDLTSHTQGHVPATYTLAAAIFHHGHWVKHYSAHVKTPNGKWYSFNDEHVAELSGRSSGGNPMETHPNYFSLGTVAQKYKSRHGLRVSRGAFIWVYVRKEHIDITTNIATGMPSSTTASTNIVAPPDAVVEYVLHKQEESQNVNHQLRVEMRREKSELLTSLQVADASEEVTLISEPLLSAWYFQDGPYFAPPDVLARPLCEHKFFSPRKCHLLKCVRAEGVGLLLTHRAGITLEETVTGEEVRFPLTLSAEEGCCRTCMVRGANHVLFIKHVKDLHRIAKKESKRVHQGPTRLVGMETLEFWPRIALNAYIKEHGIDMEEAEESENGTEKKGEDSVIDRKNEDNGRNGMEIDECGESVGVHINGEKYDTGAERTVPSEPITSSCDNTSNISTASRYPVPDTQSGSDSACDSRTNSQEKENDSDSTNTERQISETEVNKTSESHSEKISKNTDETDDGEKASKSKGVSGTVGIFNEDIVCEHNLLSPTRPSCRLPQDLANEIISLCNDAVHPAIYQEDFETCPECGTLLQESQQACEDGKRLKKQLSNLFQEKKRPHPMRDVGRQFFLLARDFFTEWKTYIRSCERGDLLVDAPKSMVNDVLLCTHRQLLFPILALQPHELTEHLVLTWEEEWDILKSHYPPDSVITASYSDSGILITQPGMCENGCVEERAAQDYEEQFEYEHEIIHVRQVNAVTDIPRRQGSGRSCKAATVVESPSTPSSSQSSDNSEQGDPARKKPRLAALGRSGAGVRAAAAAVSTTSSTASSHRLVRASRTFSSTDTLREVQNFIAERTGIWPMLQTLWICGEGQQGERGDDSPLQLNDEQRAMTLNALRVLPGDTIYFRAAIRDLKGGDLSKHWAKSDLVWG